MGIDHVTVTWRVHILYFVQMSNSGTVGRPSRESAMCTKYKGRGINVGVTLAARAVIRAALYWHRQENVTL